ncbi:gamma-glutamyltransferase [Rhodobacteraceae bacterium NNCM2]|nr:gamma-glutamyltransferase [Coraliihabitans acroporae]
MIRLALLFACLALPALAQTRADPEAASGRTPKPLVTAERQMIVAAHPAASEAGLAILREGGSAADAAIAALLVLNVVEPQSSGIGGGAFALVAAPEGLTSFDARETAPAAATAELFFEGGQKMSWPDAVPTGRSIGTPGLLRLMQTLHDRYGTLPWPRLFLPAIRLAEGGFPVSPRLAASIARYQERLAGTDAEALFTPGGVPLAEGDVIRNPDLARSLRRLALSGPSLFYDGALAQDIVASVKAEPMPGGLTAADLAAYQVIEREPVCMTYGEAEVCGMGPPSSGATTVGQIIGLAARAGGDTGGPQGAHVFAEASRLAYADRAAYLADPAFVKVPVRGLLDPGYLTERAKLIAPDTAAKGPAQAGDPPWREGHWAPDNGATSPGTTHLSIIDADGLAISLTASIETAFGSKRMAGGFLLNNQLTDFSFAPVAEDGTPIVNAPGPGKRPRSSMAPTIVMRGGRPVLLTGSPGGSRIPEYVAGSLIAILDQGADPAEAAAAGHVSQRNRDQIALETGAFDDAFAEALVAMGHDVGFSEMTSGLHILQIMPDGTLRGGADPRREGVALGD